MQELCNNMKEHEINIESGKYFAFVIKSTQSKHFFLI